MRDGWQIRKLGELLERTETINPLESPDLEFNYIDVSSVSNTTFAIETTQRLKGKEAPSRARKLVRTNDIIFATIRPTLRRIAAVPPCLDKQVCSTGYVVLRSKQCLDHRFLFYFLFTEDFLRQMESLQKGASYPAVTDGDVKCQEIPLPPLPEQQRIVALLDEAFAGLATAKANAEQNLRNARAIFESHLAGIFCQRRDGWAEMSLEDATDPSCTLSYGIVQPGDDCLGGLPIVRPTDLVSKVIRLDGLKRIDPRLAEGYRRTTLHGGELLLCVRGSTGVASIAAAELKGANVTRGIVPIRFNADLVLPDLGYFLMKSEHVQNQIREKTYGAALMQVNIRDLRAITLLVPPLKEQSFSATSLNELEAETQHLTHLYERKLAALEELKKSLLQQAFSGEL